MSSPNSNSSAGNSMAAMDDQQFHASLDALLDREMASSSWMGPADEGTSSMEEPITYTDDSLVLPTIPNMTNAEENHFNHNNHNGVAIMNNMASTTASIPRQHETFMMMTNPSHHQQQHQLQPEGLPNLMSTTIKEAFPRLAGSVGQPSPLTARLGTVPMTLTLPQQVATSLPTPQAIGPAPPAAAAAAVAPVVAPSPLPPPPDPQETPLAASISKPQMTGKRSRSSVASAPAAASISTSAVSEDEEEKLRRRYDRNVREQQRSHKITEQIDYLRDVLASAKVPFKPNKFSILFNVARYIEQLQERSSTLDVEHKKLLDTITRTNEMVNRHLTTHSASSNNAIVSDTSSMVNDSSGEEPQPDSLISQLEDDAMVFVQGLDYRGVFRHCGVALAVASIDGRFLDCNAEFEELVGFTRRELIPAEFDTMSTTEPSSLPDSAESSPVLKARKITTAVTTEPASASTCNTPTPKTPKNLSMFNVLTRQDMEIVFLAMSDMLKRLVDTSSSTKPAVEPKDYWSGLVKLCRRKDQTLRMNVSLVRSRHGRPRFFNCALTPEWTKV